MADPMTAHELAEIRELCEAATPGPWRYEESWNNGGMPLADFAIPGHNSGATVEMLSADAAFIVASRSAVPRLLAKADRLRTDDEIDKFRASERARMQPMREAARKEAFVQGYIAGRFPNEDERTDEELLSELPAADAAYAKVILKHRGPA